MIGLATSILAALDEKREIAPISQGDPRFDLDAAYAVAGALMAARMARNERPAGWKIGLTNRAVWPDLGIDAPIWAPVYEHTVHASAPGDGILDLPADSFIDPRIEPEIVFRMARKPRSDMTPQELLGCIDAIGHSFEIVQSVYGALAPKAADIVAAAGYHGALVHGPLVPIGSADAGGWAEKLSTFSIALYRDGMEVERGVGTNVLGGPLAALHHLVVGIEARPSARGIEPGDLITTGTVTKACPVAAGETWSTVVEGLPLPGMRLRFS